MTFENKTQRYVVKVPGNPRLKRIKAENLADVAATEPVAPPVVAAVAQVVGAPVVQSNVPQKGLGQKLSVCNGYATHSPIQVFTVSGDGKHYTHVVKDLEFQSCSDVENLPANKGGSLVFVIGKFQVARKSFDFSTLTPGQGLELVVFRNNPNSLKAVVHENPVEIGDSEAYYLHIVNAYAGRKPLELHVQRGKFLQKLPLDKTYRLDREQTINMVLSDGSRKLRLAFQPRKARTYCVMATGVDEGLRGEPRNVGLVAHEIGAWTSSEEMVSEASPSPPAPGSPAAVGQSSSEDAEEAPDAEPAPPPEGHMLGLASVIGGLFSRAHSA